MVVGRRQLARLARVDRLVLLPAGLLILAGLFLIQSATFGTERPYLAGQVHWLLISLLAAVPLMLVPYSRLLPYAPLAYAGGLLLLLGVLFFAPAVNGARRWISLLGLSFQPSELMKLLSVLVCARLMRFGRPLARPREWLGPLVLMGLPMLLILKEPDLGTAMLFVPLLAAILVVGGVPWRTLLGLGLAGALVVFLGYNLLLHDYQRERITNTYGFSSTTARERAGGAYQLDQSLIAIGNGGLLGWGHLQGPRTQGGLLPYRHNDFIFAVLTEEHGFLGAALVLLLVWLLAAAIFRVARHTRDPAGRLLCVGVGTWLAFQALIHAGVTLGLVPTTGMPFPFLSHGGSALLSSVLAVALVLNVSIHRPAVPIRTTRLGDD